MDKEPENLILRQLRETRGETAAFREASFFRADATAMLATIEASLGRIGSQVDALSGKVDRLIDIMTGTRAELAAFMKKRLNSMDA